MRPLEPTEDTYTRELDLSLWRRLLRYTRRYRRSVAALVLCGITTALVDASFPLVTRGVVDDVVAHGMDADWTRHGLTYGALTLVICLSVLGFVRAGGTIRTHVSHDIRRDGFETLQRLSFSFFDRRPVGWLMARMTSDCDRLTNILAWGVLDTAWGLTVMTAVAGAMFYMEPRLALFALATVPVLVAVSLVFKRRILRTSRIIRKTNSRITASYNESIMAVRTSKAFVRHDHNLEEFGGLADEMYRGSVSNALQNALYLPLVLTLGSIATGLALSLGGIEVTAGRISVGTLIAFLTYTRYFFEPVGELAHWFAEMQMAQASAERILGLIDETPEVRDTPVVRHAVRSNRRRGSAPGRAEDGFPERVGRIEFRGVSFRYGDGNPVLEHLDLVVDAGETVALVGSTGGGKSTLVNLLCRFYEPRAGEILFDGVDYRRRSLHWLQSNLGIVLQTPFLFSGTVGENIRYGRLDATDAEVEAAARQADAHDFIAALPDGYDTEVGEAGSRLSTGEKQLVSFARAILAEPQILVMDEATSSVDTETEQRIQRALEHVIEGRTTFVIAHRLSTVRAADRILVIEDGGIAEAGTHAELLARRGRYHELYVQQSLRESGFGRSRGDGAEAPGARRIGGETRPALGR